jgi:hypothetical protein
MERSDPHEIYPLRGSLFSAGIAVTLVLLLPLAGATTVGKPLAAFLQFPPKTTDVPHAPFSLPVFLGLTVLILAATAPLLLRLVSFRRKEGPRKPVVPFPWWGWSGAGLGVASWILAWGRFPWMGGFQAHTFAPLWIAFILLVNAFTLRRTGRCLMLSRTRPFLLLFPVSAGFWWSFEYLNRFVGNWRYVGGPEFGAVEYFLFATLPFATVLPAVLSTRELLLSFPRLDGAFREWRPLSSPNPGVVACAGLLFSSAGLFAVGIVPDFAFPLVWAAPPTLLISLAALRGEPHALSGIAAGDWRAFVATSLAALWCGFFWEMWNSGSLAKWVYVIPYVDAFHLFEMPLLGYAGYLPFGLACAATGDLLLDAAGRGPETQR